MDAFRFSRWLVSFSLAALLCGCGGGGGGSAALPPVTALTPVAPPVAAAAQSVPFTIALPGPTTTSGSARRPRYVSAGTKSATIAYAGQKQVINCANNACSGLLTVPAGNVTFIATLFDQFDGGGNALAQGQTNSVIVAGQPNHIQITFGGVVAALALQIAPSTLPAGSAASVPVVVTAKDAAGYTIVGSAPFTSPVIVADDDTTGATTLSAPELVGPASVTTLTYNGSGNGTTVHLTAHVADPAVAAAGATLTIAAKPTPGPSATPSPAPVPTPTPAPGPSKDPRSLVWSVGDPWGLPASADGQGADQPAFSAGSAACAAESSGAAQCTGGSGAVSFHVQRPNTTTVPSLEYRNMMVLQKWNADHSYAFNYELIPNAVYDVRFQTVNHMKDDALGVQSLVWQNHAGDGSVNLALGMINRDGQGNQFFFNYGMLEGDDNHWHGTTAQGAVDTWEVQFRNAQDASGFVDMYRNGKLEVHYNGPVVKTTAYDLMSFGIYYYDWEISRSTLLSTDITFNYFALATIPGPVAPYGQ